MNDNKQLIEHSLNYSDPKVIETIRQTVAVGATDIELAMFVEYCKGTGLNPIKKEIWFIKANGRVQMMTGINGFVTTANRHPQFDGMQWGVVDPNGELVSAAYPKNDFIAAWCTVHRKDRKYPSHAVTMLSEYDKKHGNWGTMKRTMIIKCAKSVALREAFPQELGSLYTPDEMPTQFAEPQPAKPAWAPTPPMQRKPAPFYYDMSLIAEAKREEAIAYADGEGATLDQDSGLWVSDHVLPKLKKATAQAPVPKPVVDMEDDLPDSMK